MSEGGSEREREKEREREERDMMMKKACTSL